MSPQADLSDLLAVVLDRLFAARHDDDDGASLSVADLARIHAALGRAPTEEEWDAVGVRPPM